jgi:hypothetical protein
MTAASDLKTMADQADPATNVAKEGNKVAENTDSAAEQGAAKPKLEAVSADAASAAHVYTPPPAAQAAGHAVAQAPTQPERSGFWSGVLTGVVATLALAAFPVYEGVIKHREHSAMLAQAQGQNLELRVAMAQKDLGVIEARLAEIAALEAEFRAMQAQKQELHQQRDSLAQKLRNLQQSAGQ